MTNNQMRRMEDRLPGHPLQWDEETANDEILALHRRLAAEKLRADRAEERADAKSKECIELRERMAAVPLLTAPAPQTDTNAELKRIAAYWEDQARRGCVDAFQCALREAWKAAQAAPAPQQSESIESREFHELAMDYRGASATSAHRAYQALIDYIDGKIAAAKAAPAAPVQVVQMLRDLTEATDTFMKGGVAPVRQLLDKAAAMLTTAPEVAAPVQAEQVQARRGDENA
jgi:hypothetical protein